MRNTISVIIPVYNVQRYLLRIINDLENQSFKDFEVLLIDDGSTDKSGDICDHVSQTSPLSVRVVHKKNGGLSDARNVGIDISNGQYLTFIDPDDNITPDYLEYLYNLILKSDCLVSVCSHIVMRGNSEHVGVQNGKDYEIVSSRDYIKGLLYHVHFDTSAWAKLFDRNLFKNVLFPKGKLYEDLATIYKLVIAAGKVCVGNEPKYLYNIRDESITNTKFSKSQLDFIDVTKKMKEDIDNTFPELKMATEERLVFSYISTLTKTFNGQQSRELLIIQKHLVHFIITNKKAVLENDNSSKRDKISVRIIVLSGLHGFRFFWNLYTKLRKL